MGEGGRSFFFFYRFLSEKIEAELSSRKPRVLSGLIALLESAEADRITLIPGKTSENVPDKDKFPKFSIQLRRQIYPAAKSFKELASKLCLFLVSKIQEACRRGFPTQLYMFWTPVLWWGRQCRSVVEAVRLQPISLIRRGGCRCFVFWNFTNR